MIINVVCKSCGHEGTVIADLGPGVLAARRESTERAKEIESTLQDAATRFFGVTHICEKP